LQIDESIKRLSEACQNINKYNVKAFAKIIVNCEGVLWICGNGGSASNADHAVNDLMKMGGVVAVPLTQVAVLSAYANDIGYESCFAQPLRETLSPDDVLMVISVSGRSENIIAAMKEAKQKGTTVLALFGMLDRSNIEATNMANEMISVKDSDYGIVETVHQGILHLIADEVRQLKGRP
jgi:D-sedoheptulose 7-phosphate isomerase